jgi:hypothetical protein
MIGFLSLLVGVVLLILLLLVGVKGLLTARELEQATDIPADYRDAREAFSEEIATKIFSRADWEFVSRKKFSGLEKLFLSERKALALLWVRQTAGAIRRVMREHAEAARKSRDLQVATELKLFMHYGELLSVCGLLFVAIQVAGPVWPAGLAVYAERLSRQFSGAQEMLKAATDVQQIRAASM